MGMGYKAGELREQWRAWQRERGLAASTIRAREGVLRALEARVPLHAATLADLRAVISGRDLVAQSRYTMTSHLRCFYRWAVAEGYVSQDPSLRLVRPKLPRRLPRPIPEADYALALTLCADPVLRAMLLLAGMCGLRCCEIARLTWSDVDLDARELRVVGKGNRERVVPLHPAVVAHLTDMARPTAWVTSAPTGRPRSAAMVSITINTYLRHVVATPATAHQLRHRAATRAYLGTLDLIAVQRLLGHTSVQTTQIYADTLDSAVRQAVDSIELPAISEKPEMPEAVYQLLHCVVEPSQSVT